jgi:hypothetical protein
VHPLTATGAAAVPTQLTLCSHALCFDDDSSADASRRCAFIARRRVGMGVLKCGGRTDDRPRWCEETGTVRHQRRQSSSRGSELRRRGSGWANARFDSSLLVAMPRPVRAHVPSKGTRSVGLIDRSTPLGTARFAEPTERRRVPTTREALDSHGQLRHGWDESRWSVP